MCDDLIFDVGFHKCEDTAYYLHKGYRVIAIDADPRNIEAAAQRYQCYIHSGRLTLVHAAVADTDHKAVQLHLSTNTVWTSLNLAIANRRDSHERSIEVPTRRLESLFDEFGVPSYCKIDIEGHDAICLSTLDGTTALPPFISVESECGSGITRPSEQEALETLRRLAHLGYEGFKLVDQPSLAVLQRHRTIYDAHPLTAWSTLRKAFRRPYKSNYSLAKRATRVALKEKFGFDFPLGASGPFGDDLGSDPWLNTNSAEELLLWQRRQYFDMGPVPPYGFWCDWHARMPM